MGKAGKHLVVIGGGAAGFFCAVNAARLNTGLQVTILEKTSKLLAKVKVSGGGRCNVTHACFENSALVKKYPRGSNFLKKAFQHFSTTHCVQWFEQRGVALKTEPDGRMFSITNTSQTIIDCLLAEADRFGVRVEMNAEVSVIDNTGGKFQLTYSKDKVIQADFVCIACGGYPKGSMFGWLGNLGHNIQQPVPSLFTFNMPGNTICQLMGVSVEHAQVKVAGSKLVEQGPLLITHWGMSGPVILKLSAWGARDLAERNYHFSIVVNWVPDYNEQLLRNNWTEIRNKRATQKIVNRNPFGLPNRLWEYFLEQCGIDSDLRWANLPAKEQNKLISILTAQACEVKGKTTFKEEFVTCGGIQLPEIDPNTMESRLLPNLFFAGEIMDVDGITGGFNFQHAWSSGYIAATTIAAR